jgi:predicted AAA+ superfamily ATPase
MLIPWREKQPVKVITGVRRCGKSTLLAQYVEYLKTTGVSREQIVFINFEDARYGDLWDYKSLHAYIEKRLDKKRFTYIFLDEVQLCAEFERAVNSLALKKKTDLYITGSNAYLLSGELATLLSGRYVEIPMLPFSFAEYYDFTGRGDPKTAFNAFLEYGAFPYIALLKRQDAMVKTYIDGIYNTIIVKDVAQRQRINDLSLLEDIVKFLCSAVGSPVSAKKISDTINSSGRKISVNTVDAYLRALCESFIFYRVQRYDIKGKQHLKTLAKYYIVDTGIRNLLVSGASSDLGHLLENTVFLELLRRGRRVSTGKIDTPGEREVDFVAEGGGEVAYYQVAASALNQDTLDRELRPLQAIRDNYPKYLLTLDEFLPRANYNGIRKLNALDWLLGKLPLPE